MDDKVKFEYLKTAMKFQHREAKRILDTYRYGSIHKSLQTLIDHMEATLGAIEGDE